MARISDSCFPKTPRKPLIFKPQGRDDVIFPGSVDYLGIDEVSLEHKIRLPNGNVVSLSAFTYSLANYRLDLDGEWVEKIYLDGEGVEKLDF